MMIQIENMEGLFGFECGGGGRDGYVDVVGEVPHGEGLGVVE